MVNRESTGKTFDSARSGVYLAPADVEALREEAKRAGIAWFELNLARVGNKQEFLAACAKVLRFPQWFGGNWDALADSLKEFCADCVVSCRNSGKFAEAEPDDYATALEIFQDAANYWKERGSTFVVLADAEPEGETLPRFREP
jgi:sugar phosphate isomerase/epimerase